MSDKQDLQNPDDHLRSGGSYWRSLDGRHGGPRGLTAEAWMEPQCGFPTEGSLGELRAHAAFKRRAGRLDPPDPLATLSNPVKNLGDGAILGREGGYVCCGVRCCWQILDEEDGRCWCWCWLFHKCWKGAAAEGVGMPLIFTWAMQESIVVGC